MGRKRGSKLDERLPPYVYRKPRLNCVEYRPYLGKGKFGASVYLKDTKGKQLKANATLNEVVKAYQRALKEDHEHGRSLSWLLKKYFKSPRFLSRSIRTQKDYAWYAEKIEAMTSKDGRLFGDFPYQKISRKTIVGLRDKLSHIPTQANRRLQFLSAVFSWAIEEEYLDVNPCKGVSKFTLEARDRYAEDNEYKIVYECAKDYPFLQVAMELAYLCRMRRGEILALKKSAISDIGVHVQRTKKSDSETTTWTPRLRKAVEAAQSLFTNSNSVYLLHNEDGSRITDNQFGNAWKRTIVKALKSGLNEKFTFHDLKARGVTNHPLQHSGHKTEAMKKIYIRKAPQVRATE